MVSQFYRKRESNDAIVNKVDDIENNLFSGKYFFMTRKIKNIFFVIIFKHGVLKTKSSYFIKKKFLQV